MIKNSAQKDILKLDRKLIREVNAKIKALGDNPRTYNVVKLSDEKNAWRIRVGNYRILYTIEDENRIVTIYRVRHRREVYR